MPIVSPPSGEQRANSVKAALEALEALGPFAAVAAVEAVAVHP